MNEYSVNPIIPTKFLDYTFSTTPDGSIVFDSELRPEQLHVQLGDRFEVVFLPGDSTIIFKKVVPL